MRPVTMSCPNQEYTFSTGSVVAHPVNGINVVKAIEDGVVFLDSSMNFSNDKIDNVFTRAVVEFAKSERSDLKTQIPMKQLLSSDTWIGMPNLGTINTLCRLIAEQRPQISMPTKLPSKSWVLRANEQRDLDQWIGSRDAEIDRDLASFLNQSKMIIDKSLSIYLLRDDGEMIGRYKDRMSMVSSYSGKSFLGDHLIHSMSPVAKLRLVEIAASIAELQSYCTGESVEKCAQRVTEVMDSRLNLHNQAIQNLHETLI